VKGIVYICHHIDTEGPLYENHSELINRINYVTGLNLSKDENLSSQINQIEKTLGDKEKKELRAVVNPHVVNLLGDWSEVDKTISKVTSKEFREQMLDSYGNSWVFNWHIMDHVGFTGANPRRRDLGHHKIWEYYRSKLTSKTHSYDGFHWHFHPIGFDKHAHIPATSYENSMTELHQIICRRLVDYCWFPCVNRAGFHSIRWDSNNFLESWIPFDPSNQSVSEEYQPELQRDLSNGRFGDWRGAPSDWSIYNPSIRDWRKKGEMNRYIARVLNMSSRHRNISESEIEKAFARASRGLDTYLGITNHDWRDMAFEINEFRHMLKTVSERYKEVDFKFSETKSAFRNILFSKVELEEHNHLEFSVKLENNNLNIHVTKGKIFGPQPYLAIKTKSGKYLHDNFDFGDNDNSYKYCFDEYTILTNQLEAVVVAANDKFGNQYIKKLDF